MHVPSRRALYRRLGMARTLRAARWRVTPPLSAQPPAAGRRPPFAFKAPCLRDALLFDITKPAVTGRYYGLSIHGRDAYGWLTFARFLSGLNLVRRNVDSTRRHTADTPTLHTPFWAFTFWHTTRTPTHTQAPHPTHLRYPTRFATTAVFTLFFAACSCGDCTVFATFHLPLLRALPHAAPRCLHRSIRRSTWRCRAYLHHRLLLRAPHAQRTAPHRDTALRAAHRFTPFHAADTRRRLPRLPRTYRADHAPRGCCRRARLTRCRCRSAARPYLRVPFHLIFAAHVRVRAPPRCAACTPRLPAARTRCYHRACRLPAPPHLATRTLQPAHSYLPGTHPPPPHPTHTHTHTHRLHATRPTHYTRSHTFRTRTVYAAHHAPHTRTHTHTLALHTFGVDMSRLQNLLVPVAQPGTVAITAGGGREPGRLTTLRSHGW